jgi:hypothetical protein
MTQRPAPALLWVILVGLCGAPASARDDPKKPAPQKTDFAAVLKQALAGRKFTPAGQQDPAAAVMFATLQRGDYSHAALSPIATMAQLDRLVAAACPALKLPSQLVKDSTPFLLTGEFDATVAPTGGAITTSNLASAQLALPSGKFLAYSMTLSGARVAPAPIVDVRAVDLGACQSSGEALSLIDGTTTDGTIVGQGLVAIGGEPVWVVAGRADRQIGLSLQPLNRRQKGYRVDDGWKFLGAP